MSWKRRYGRDWGRLGLRFRTATIGDIASVQTGPFGSQLHQKDYVLNGTPIVTVEHLGLRKMTRQNLPSVSDADKKRLSKYVLQYGDLVFSRVGSVDRCSWVNEDEDGWMFSGRCLRVRPKDAADIYHKYLYYFFCLESTKDYVRSVAVGATMPSINTKLLSDVTIAFPDIDKQRHIGDMLSALDDKIEKNKVINHHLEQMAHTIFKSWFVDFEPWGGEQPTEWLNSSIGEVCDVKGGKRLPKGENLTTIPNAHPYIRVRDMNDSLFVQMTSSVEYVPCEIQAGISRYIVSANDVIISIVGTIGLVCIVHPSLDKANLTENCVKLTNRKRVSSSWLYLFLSSDEGQEQIRNVTVGAVQPKLPIKNIQSISFPLPSSAIMDEFDGVVSGLFDTMANNYAENARLADMRSTLLPRLMSGELSVTDLTAK